jgi:FHS family glucose/mannose:H+ symporter-like MFS transporter
MTNQSTIAREPRRRRWSLSGIILGVGFALTGAGTVMLGVLLPTLSRKWGMLDSTAGFLLFLQFLGSSLGAIFTEARRIRSIAIGYGLLVISAGVLAFAGMALSFVIFFFFGVGLGMAMTATSLLVSDRYGNNRTAWLERLNFAWAAGATAAPICFLPFLRMPGLSPLFFTLQGLFLLVLLWVVLGEDRGAAAVTFTRDAAEAHNRVSAGSVLPLVILAACSVGVEGSLSGWLTTYSHRADVSGAGGAAYAASLFWFGIVISRLVFSTRLLAVVGRRRLLRTVLWGVAVAVVLLVAAHQPVTIRIAAALAGFCLGPLYPLLLSFILQRTAKGWVFAAAGLGSALLPWLTGLFSAQFGSLRYGLLAPCAAAALMIVLSKIALRPEEPLAAENSGH